MKLKNFLITVKDIERSKRFYKELFGLNVIRDFDGNVILTGGLVLQDAAIWKDLIGADIVEKSNSCELYFEEKDVEAFAEKLRRLYPEVKVVNDVMTHSWGQTVIRFYDPDGNLIEVGTPFDMAPEKTKEPLTEVKSKAKSILARFKERQGSGASAEAETEAAAHQPNEPAKNDKAIERAEELMTEAALFGLDVYDLEQM